MAVHSMTGFARVEGGVGAASWAWEARSVNGRNLDVRMRLPQSSLLGGEPWDMLARESAKAALNRGTVHLSLQIQAQTREPAVRINRPRLRAYVGEAVRLSRYHGVRAPSAEALLGLRGVLDASPDTLSDGEAGEDAAPLIAALKRDLTTVMETLAASCLAEGRSLSTTLLDVLDQMEQRHGEASSLAAIAPQKLRERLQHRLSELAADHVPAERLAQEAALLAVKADVREELDRIAAHIAAARDLLHGGGAVGRKLDFLAQEFMREANTMCAKSSDMELTRVGLAVKALVEQFREQAQNVA